jgi:hypothetical protein
MGMFETQDDLLPALVIEVSGIVQHSNLDAFRAAALERIGAVNRDLRTDQDFAQAEQAVKWCGDIESRLSTAKAAALAQTAGIDQLFRAIDDISAEARKVRLELSKLVTMRKDEVKGEICAGAIAAFREHVAALSQSVGIQVPAAPADFAQAIKGRRTVAGLQDAVSAELGRAVSAADALAERMTVNLREMSRRSECGLFPDRAALAVRHPGEVLTIIDERVAARHAEEQRKEQERQAAELRRLEAERARIRAEEQARADAEQRRAAQALAAERAAFERQQAEALAVEQQRAKDAQDADDARRRALRLEEQAKTAPAPIQMRVAPAADEAPTLKLGTICDRLGFTVTAAFLTSLGITHSATDKAAKLYRPSDFARICDSLIRHIELSRADL